MRKSNTLSEYKLLFISTFVLFLSFAFNTFHVSRNIEFNRFQHDSEVLVTNLAKCEALFDQRWNHGFMLRGFYEEGYNLVKNSDDCSPDNRKLYLSQYGFQGRLVSYLALNLKFIPIDMLFIYMKNIHALITAIVISLFVVGASREFGKKVGYLLVVLFSMSLWIVLFARNLYWTSYLLFLPMTFSMLYYPKIKSKLHRFLFYMTIGLMVFLKSLNGYEYLSNVVLSSYIPVLYYSLKASKTSLYIFKQLIYLVFASVIGFAIALVVHLYTLAVLVGSIERAILIVKDRAALRTFGSTEVVTQNFFERYFIEPTWFFTALERYTSFSKLNNTLWEPVIAYGMTLMHYLLMPMLTIGYLSAKVASLFGSLLTLIAITTSILVKWHKTKIVNTSTSRSALSTSVIVAFIASNAWNILGFEHSVLHTHMNGIIYYLPYLSFAYIAISVEIINNFVPNMKAFYDKYR